MFDQHSLLLDHSGDVIHSAFLSLPPEYKWGDGLLYPDHATRPPVEVGETRLVLRDGRTVIEEYTETLIDSVAPETLALSLKLDDFALSTAATQGNILPSAATLSRARAKIADGSATNLVITLTLTPHGPQTEATLTFATAGQTRPSLAARLFRPLRRNSAKTMLDWFATHLAETRPTPSSL